MISGIVNVKKEAGMTSHDAVFRLRKIVKEKKMGHGGTLDPDVTGVLPIAMGKATRLIEYMQEGGKTYEGEITLGFSTTTEDASGELVAQAPVPASVTEQVVDEQMAQFIGKVTQIPPMYSAVKVNGRKLYEYARNGESVERPKRQVTIESFERTSPFVVEDSLVRFSFRVVCSKGTYVRTLAVDLGERLGVPSHMSQLVRTSAAGMSLDNSLTLTEIAEKVSQDDWSFLQPIENGLGNLPVVNLSSEQLEEIRFGRFISLNNEETSLAALYQEKLVAILEKRDRLYKPNKVFV